MNNRAKKTLLERKFTSYLYAELYVGYFKEMVNAMESGMQEFSIFYQKKPTVDAHNIKDWQSRGLPILQGDYHYAVNALKKAQKGDLNEISGSAGNLRGLSKDVDNIGGFGEWWQHIDEQFKKDFYKYFKLASRTGCNIYYTVDYSWDGDEILDEEITGSIDEVELLNYLKSNEKLADIS